MAQYLDLVALGTVADVVPLDQSNRILVHRAARIRRGTARPGIAALARVGKHDLATLSAADMGLPPGPSLMLPDMQGYECGYSMFDLRRSGGDGQLAAELDKTESNPQRN